MQDRGPRLKLGVTPDGLVYVQAHKTDGGWLIDSHSPGSQVIVFISDADAKQLVAHIQQGDPAGETEKPATDVQETAAQPAPEPEAQPAPDSREEITDGRRER